MAALEVINAKFVIGHFFVNDVKRCDEDVMTGRSCGFVRWDGEERDDYVMEDTLQPSS